MDDIFQQRKACNFYRSYWEIAKEIEDPIERCAYYDAVLTYEFTGEKIPLTGISKFAFISQAHSLDKQVLGYKTGKTTPPPTPPRVEDPIPLGANETQEKEQVQEEVQVQVKEEKSIPENPKKEFSAEVKSCYLSCLEYFDLKLRPYTDKKKFNWMDCIDKLNRIDGLTFKEILEIVKNTRNDNFWKIQFLTLTKLRDNDKNDVKYWLRFQTLNNNKTPQNGTAKAKSTEQMGNEMVERLFGKLASENNAVDEQQHTEDSDCTVIE